MAPKHKKKVDKKPPRPVLPPALPDNFANLIVDFTRDLSITFPEYVHLWEKWTSLDMPETEVCNIFEYCLSVYPERFFDILYQNADIFKPDSDANTFFLPGVDFKLLYNCENVSENTQKAIWKYLQVLLLASVNSIKDKANFGDTMNMFDGIDEGDLQSKLAETISGITDFFKGMDNEMGGESDSDVEDVPIDGETPEPKNNGFPSGMPDFAKTFNFEKMAGSMPNAEDLHGHLKGLFNGKIGSLAKEMAEEISKDFNDILGGEADDIRSTQDVLKNMMKNPKKIMDLMKTVGAKLNAKMENGDISQDELMKEATEWIGKMKDMGGTEQFTEMFKNLTKNMGGLGKNMKFDTNALDRMTKKESTRERMLKKLKERQQAKAAKESELTNSFIEPTETPNNFVFRVNDGGQQEKSKAKSTTTAEYDVDAIVAELNITNEDIGQNVHKSSKKKKNKK